MTVAMDSEEDGHELPVDTETPETILMSRSNSELVQRAIYNLPVHYRETLLLCEVEEMSYQEIAGILSIPTGTVMSRLASARKAVRESLAALPVDRHPRTQPNEPGATREVSADPVFLGEKDEALARPFSDLEIGSIGQEHLHR